MRVFFSLAIINNINNPIKPEKLKTLINKLELLERTQLKSQTVLNWPQDKKLYLPSLILPPVKAYNENFSIPSLYWITGFICGEGAFTYYTKTSPSSSIITESNFTDKNETRVDPDLKNVKISHNLVLEISQRTKDIYIFPKGQAIYKYFGAGNIYSDRWGISKIKFSNIKIIQHQILPFFYFYPLLGFKLQQFEIWIKAVTIKICEGLSKNKKTSLDSNSQIFPLRSINIENLNRVVNNTNTSKIIQILKELRDLRNK